MKCIYCSDTVYREMNRDSLTCQICISKHLSFSWFGKIPLDSGSSVVHITVIHSFFICVRHMPGPWTWWKKRGCSFLDQRFKAYIDFLEPKQLFFIFLGIRNNENATIYWALTISQISRTLHTAFHRMLSTTLWVQYYWHPSISENSGT